MKRNLKIDQPKHIYSKSWSKEKYWVVYVVRLYGLTKSQK